MNLAGVFVIGVAASLAYLGMVGVAFGIIDPAVVLSLLPR